MKTRKKYLLAKIESTYGTDPTPVAGDAILTMGLQREVYGGPTVQRNNDRDTLGADETINTAPMVTAGFQVEIAGAGAAGDVPAYGSLLRACGFAETINASTSVEYEPVSASYESITAYYDRDGERQVMKGMRGNVGLSIVAGQLPVFNFNLTGLYAKPATQTPVTPDTSSFEYPLPVNYTNTTACTIGSYDVLLQSLELDIGNQVPHLNMVNYEEVLITDREATGTMTLLAPTIATEDLFALVESHNGISTDTFQLIHGTTAGNKFQIDAPKIQLAGISEVDIQGEQGYQIPFRLLYSSGDDEVKFTVL